MLDADRMRAEPSSVPVQIFDLEGALLVEAAAQTTRDAAAPSDTDVLVLILQGRALPGFGPTSVPTLARLDWTPVVAESGKPDVVVQPPDGWEADDRRPDDRRPDERVEPDDGETRDDTPSGSALSTLDAVALFGEAARGQFAARG